MTYDAIFAKVEHMRTPVFAAAFVLSLLSLSSCAYMQTHKCLEENFCRYSGYELESPLYLTMYKGQPYLVAEKTALHKSYPIVHDTIFFTDNNEPVYEKMPNGTPVRVMHRISAGTATVLQRGDGYADWETLCDELRSTPGDWVPLPAGQGRLPVLAMIDTKPCRAGEQHCRTIVEKADEENRRLPVGVRVLSAVDRCLIDWPGTVLYNVSIPVMAPFVFFRDFLSGE